MPVLTFSRSLVTTMLAAGALLAVSAVPLHPAHDGSRVCVGTMKTVACVPPEQIPPSPPDVPRL